MVTARKHKMTVEEATLFEGFSLTNAKWALHQLVGSGVCDGTCQPYSDIFTYNRWNAQGFQVQKGQHGAKLTIYREVETEEDGKAKVSRRPWHTTVFCRHQVAENWNYATEQAIRRGIELAYKGGAQ